MQKRHLSDKERLAWLRLARTPRVGPVTFYQLLSRFKTASAALAGLADLARKNAALKPVTLGNVCAELEALNSYGGHLVCACEPDYPRLLSFLDSPPPVLTTFDTLDLAQKDCVAIVGARNASAAGRRLTRDMAGRLSQAGYVTVSGMARGIDGEAHAASLDGGTIAVLAGGIDHVYPAVHDRLYAAIAEQGLIISESRFGYQAKARDFPRRNRLITGLAAAVIIIEAAERSGSLISARIAAEQGREVMAVPGSPLDPRAAGTNRLLQQGASLVCSADDVLNILSHLPGTHVDAPPKSDYTMPEPVIDVSQEQIEAVFEALSPNPMPIDELACAAGISVPLCAAILAELELAGRALTFCGGLAALDC